VDQTQQHVLLGGRKAEEIKPQLWWVLCQRSANQTNALAEDRVIETGRSISHAGHSEDASAA